MAKKKSSVKKAVKKTAKKVVKKTAKKVAKKVIKKTVAKKTPSKKAPIKKSAPKAAKKAAVKKTAPVKKAAVKKASVKQSKPVTQHLVKAPAAKKLVDLNDFVTPLDDRLIVQTSGAEKMTAGGLYIPDTVADVSGNLHGTVVAVGRGHVTPKGHLRPMELKVGDKVVFSQYAGSKINLQNEDLVILRETEVMGVVEK